MVLAGFARLVATGARRGGETRETMKYTTRTSVVRVIGRIWMPSTIAAQAITLSLHDVENARDSLGRVTRESVQRWLDSHAGDFAEIADFEASIEVEDEWVEGGTVDIPWADEESEMIYIDCMSGDEDY
jgi:hypothetical protein